MIPYEHGGKTKWTPAKEYLDELFDQESKDELAAKLAEFDRCQAEAFHSSKDILLYGTVGDGFGTFWARCKVDCKMEVVRPGKVQCECEREGAKTG